MKRLALFLWIALVVASCANTGDGQLVGVMNAQVAGKQSYNIGIYSSYLLELIEKAKITE